MLQEIIEPGWLDAFEQVLRRCALQKGDTVAILAETQSRPVLPQLARLAAQRLGAQVFMLTLPAAGKASAMPPGQCVSVPGRVVKPQLPPATAPSRPMRRSVPAGEVTVIAFAPRNRLMWSFTRASVASSGISRTSASGCSLLM